MIKKYCIYSVNGKAFYSKREFTLINWEEDILKAKTYNEFADAEKDIKQNLPPGLYDIKTIYMKL